MFRINPITAGIAAHISMALGIIASAMSFQAVSSSVVIVSLIAPLVASVPVYYFIKWINGE